MISKSKNKKIYRKILIITGNIIILFAALYLGFNYSTGNTGYRPVQPVSFSHKLHMDKYNIKCLYCHYSAEKTSFSNIPTTFSCMVCHVAVRNESELLKSVNKSNDEKVPLRWSNVYRLPEYSHFDHGAHVRALIDCSSCHGKVEQMDSVYQAKALTMKWCLDCHRQPEKFIIPARDISGIFTYDLDFKDKANKIKLAESRPLTEPAYGLYESRKEKQLFDLNVIRPKNKFVEPKLPGKGPETCSACHY